MKKQKVKYLLHRHNGQMLEARREISFELQLSSRLILDELCFNWNKKRLQHAINRSIEQNDRSEFIRLSADYQQYV